MRIEINRSPEGSRMVVIDRARDVVSAPPHRVVEVLRAALMTIDAGLLAVTGLLAFLGRQRMDIFAFTGSSVSQENILLPGTVMLLWWLALIWLCGAYRRNIVGSGPEEFKRVLHASVLAGGTTGVMCYLLKFEFSRGYFLLAFAIGPVALVLGRFVVRRMLQDLRRNGRLQSRVLLVGTTPRVDEISQVLRRENWLGYGVMGALTAGGTAGEETGTGVPILGDSSEIIPIAARGEVNLVVLTGGVLASAEAMNELVWELESHGTSVVVAPSVAAISSDRLLVRPVGGVPLIHIEQPRWARAGRIGKRAFDILGSASLLLLLSPVLAYAALRVKLHDRGPIMFRQARVGRNGAHFGCFKFRTMVTDAEAQLLELQRSLGKDALLFKMRDDPRITGPGKWLRRFSIDELPQLFNVLRGDMSLVGPRPQVQKEVDLYAGGMARRLLVRPGMTGLWQVSGRNNLPADEAMRLDIYYVDNWSMIQDLWILVRTVSAVLTSRGAY